MKVLTESVWSLYPPQPNEHGEVLGPWQKKRQHWCEAKQKHYRPADGKENQHSQTFELVFRHPVELAERVEFRGKVFRVLNNWEGKATVVTHA